MTNINDVSSLCTVFSKHAVPPEQHIANAESFLSALQKAGTAPSEQDKSTGERLLASLAHHTELYAFYATLQAGHESSSAADLDRRVEQIQSGIDQAEKMRERLSSALGMKTALA